MTAVLLMTIIFDCKVYAPAAKLLWYYRSNFNSITTATHTCSRPLPYRDAVPMNYRCDAVNASEKLALREKNIYPRAYSCWVVQVAFSSIHVHSSISHLLVWFFFFVLTSCPTFSPSAMGSDSRNWLPSDFRSMSVDRLADLMWHSSPLWVWLWCSYRPVIISTPFYIKFWYSFKITFQLLYISILWWMSDCHPSSSFLENKGCSCVRCTVLCLC